MAEKEEKTVETLSNGKDVSSETSAAVPEKREETVGEILRRTRLAKKWEIRDIASYLCIRAQFLEDIEEGRNKDLPGTAYAVGFVRSYAAYLGLNAADMVSRYKEELSETQENEDAYPSYAPEDVENSVPGIKLIVFSVLLLAVVFGLYKAFWEQEDPSEYASVETVTVVEDVYQDDGAPSPSVSQETGTETASEPPSAPVPPKKPEQAVQETVADTSVQGKPFVAESFEVAEEVPTRHIYGQKNYNARVVLVATADAWIEVTRGDMVLISRTLKAGDRYQASRDSDDLYLKTGNAGGLDVYVEGLLVPPLGPKGATRKVPLDPEYLLPKTAED